MKHMKIRGEAEVLETEPLALSNRSDANAASNGEIDRLRSLVESQYRMNQTLAAMLHERGGDESKGKTRQVEVSPRLHRASWTTRPKLRSEDEEMASNWPTRRAPPVEALVAPMGYECQSLAGVVEETVGVSVLGLRGADLEKVVAAVAEEQRRQGSYRVVFLTDQSDFTSFTRRGYVFEYLRPELDFIASGSPDRIDRLREQYSRKWGFSRIIDRNETRGADRQYPPLALVTKHNSEMSRACHADRFAWAGETLRLAVATERYDVVDDLADYLLAWYDRITPSTQVQVARALCRKFLAFGELDMLQRFLFKNYNRVSSDDFLFTLFAIYCTSDKEFVPSFTTLPSGKLNSYYLSKRLSVAGDQVLPVLMKTTEANAPNANILFANHFAQRRQADSYRLFVNRALSRAGSTQIRKLALHRANMLDTIEFEPPSAAPRQDDLVSVIMSAHNSRDTLAYAVRSILRQSYTNLELLLCDDSPEPGSYEALGALRSDPRLRLFRSQQPEQGTYNIRNNLIRQARGTLITFHDSDDLAFPDRIERQVDHLRQHAVAAVCGQWYRVSKAGDFVFSAEHSVARLAVVSLMAPKAVFEAVGPYRPARFGADTEYYENLRMRFGSAAVPLLQTPLMFGLSSEGSLTRRAGMEASEDGYRSEARRAYATFSSRRRLLGWAETDTAVESELEGYGILVQNAGVQEEAR